MGCSCHGRRWRDWCRLYQGIVTGGSVTGVQTANDHQLAIHFASGRPSHQSEGSWLIRKSVWSISS